MTYAINEIFTSIQGEGGHSGVPSIFVRFAGCNRKCSFCDTPDETNMELEEEKLLDVIQNYFDESYVENVVFTGGEPMLQPIEPLILALDAMGVICHIETNGTIEVPSNIYLRSYVTVSPKEIDFVQRTGYQLKLIYTGEPVDLKYYFEETNFVRYFLQPEWSGGSELARKAVEVVMEDQTGAWRFGAQIHKLIGVK